MKRVSAWLAAIVAATGAVALTGWFMGADPLGVLPFQALPMKPHAALCLILCGASLGLQLQPHPVVKRFALALAVMSLLISGGILAERLLALDFGFSGWLTRAGTTGIRMSSHAALALGAMSIALITLRQERGRRKWPLSAWLSNVVVGVGAAGLLAGEFATNTAVIRPLRLSSHLCIALMLLAAGTLLARPADRHLQVLFARTTGGILARRLFVGVAVVPLTLGALLAWLVRENQIGLADGVLLFVVGMIVSGFGVALFSIETAADINQDREDSEHARQQLLAQLQDQAARLQETVTQQTQELRTANSRLQDLNQRFELAARASEVGVWEWNAREQSILWDQRTLAIYGLKAGSFKGTLDEWKQRLHPKDRDSAIARVQAELEKGTQYEHAFRIIRADDGAERHIHSCAIILRDATGKVVRVTGTERDVTADREAQQRVEALNERLRLALRSSNYGVWEYDIVNNRRNWDDRILEMFGLQRSEFDETRTTLLERVHPEDRPATREHLQQVLAGTASEYALRFRVVRPDGSIRHLDSHGYVQRDAEGVARRLVGLSRDVTEHHQMAQALDLAEQRWQLAIEATNDSVWDWDLTTGRIFHDERWARMLGYERGELNETHEGWRSLVHPDDRVTNETLLREHFEQRAPSYQHEVRVRAKDGSWRWVLDRGRIVRRNPEGQPLRMAGTHTDITARKELEQRLRKSEQLAAEVSRIAQIGGWEIDLLAMRVTWTDGTRRILEVDDNFQPSMATLWNFFPPDSATTVRSAFNDTTPANPSFDIQVPLLTARGSRRWVRMLGRGEFVQGRTVMLQGAVQDVTAQHESAEARRQLEAQLFQAQKMETLGTLAGGIAHDFNNLLTGILGYHELATDLMPDEHPARPCLIEARNASMRARQLVDQILTFGRQSAGTEHGPIDLGVVIDEARRFLRATLPANVTIEVNRGGVAATVLGDATQLHQVLLNLGSNAAHAMRPQGGLLRISLEPTEVPPDLALTLGSPAASSYVRLSVSDTGHGMDEAVRRRIFDPFFTTKNTREGTGLGLAVVHGIVRSHHGVIDVESLPGHGSTFHVYLPSAQAPEKIADASAAVAPRGGGEFICVVDDEEVVGSCTKLVLENKGYRSVTFTSAEQCLAELTANPAQCSVLITDQTMPGMQGTELATALRRVAPTLPVVVMSGYFSKVSAQALDELGQVELLGKPFTTDELLHAVHRALNPAPKVKAS